ncbi:MAG: hypothetical protein JXA28_05600, partial [Bacteroidetes bacterium]|nr:hypothetical protein [Bacteroidota bacterium]
MEASAEKELPAETAPGVEAAAFAVENTGRKHPLSAESTRSVQKVPAQCRKHPLSAENTRSVQKTPAQCRKHP